jgi:hypothetical protein
VYTDWKAGGIDGNRCEAMLKGPKGVLQESVRCHIEQIDDRTRRSLDKNRNNQENCVKLDSQESCQCQWGR